MKKIVFFTTALLLNAFFLFISCEDKEENKNQGKIEFQISIPESKLKSFNQSDTASIAYVLISIKDKSGSLVFNNEEIAVYKMGDQYLTKPIYLKPGEYTLTTFCISNKSKEITFATPVQGSKLSYLVNQTLPINFTVKADQVLKLVPEVITTENVTPAEFGYSTFSFKVIKNFNIYVSAFIYNETIKNYELTDGLLKLTYQNDTTQVNLPLGNLTNLIALPEKQTVYTLTASKSGYNSISYSFTLDSIKSYQARPLMFIFNKENSSLVAYLPFNNNVLDYSGYKNNGVLSGALPAKDNLDSAKSAYSFDGNDDYVKIPNSPSLNPTDEITVSAWYKTTPFVGSGNDGLVNKAYSSHVDPYYQYHLGVCGNGYWNGQSGFGFNVTLDDKLYGASTGSNFYQLYTWYHVVGTYDGSNVKIYVNGNLVDSKPASGKMKDFGSDIYIGRQGNRSDYYSTTYHLPGSIDDVRIYNKALSAEEILNLYQSK